MKNYKKIIGYTTSLIAILLILYISYFEFIYRSDLVTYLNINPQNVTAITIFKHKLPDRHQDKTENIKLNLSNKEEILEFMTNLASYPIKRKVYQEFKFTHGMTVKTKYSIPTAADYMIIIKLPTISYQLNITGGKSVIITHRRPNSDGNTIKLFEIIGESFKM